MQYPSKLDERLMLVDQERALTDIDYFNTLSLQEYRELDIGRMSGKVFGELLRTQALRIYSEALRRLAREIEVEKAWLDLFWLNQLSIEQILELVILCPSLKYHDEIVSRQLKYQFPAHLDSSPEQRVETLLKALDWTSTLPPKFSSCRKEVLFEILTLTQTYGEYRKDLFLEYLQLHGFRDIFRVTTSSDRKGNRTNDREMIHTYLEKLLGTMDSPDVFGPYLPSEYLTRMFAWAKILTGSDPAAFSLQPSSLESLYLQVRLSFAPDNPKAFTRSDEVSLKLYVKNVPQLLVRTLQVDALAYSLEHSASVPADINLDGLEAIAQEVLDYSAYSIWTQQVKTITVPVLKGKAGLFAVDLFGGGLRTRVLVKKGTIKLLQG